MPKAKETEKHASALTKLGWLLTGIWMLIFVVLVALRWSQFIELDLNELGDFLAGWFAPLAFGWLVLGFYQQGAELRLQAIELKNSVQQLARQSDAMNENTLLAKQEAISRLLRERSGEIAVAAREILELFDIKQQFFGSNANVSARISNVARAQARYDSGDVDAFHREICSAYEYLDGYGGEGDYFFNFPAKDKLFKAISEHDSDLVDAIWELHEAGASKKIIERLQTSNVENATKRLQASCKILLEQLGDG
ncbi:MAG: hypothetical protein COA62_10265 [Rhodobiaceae bacterium]|nr:MAG: hypothetical protein COA62_10265 [Rhodobiaceae bacterium]